MARPAPTAPRTGAARSEARLSEALDRANDIAGEIEGWREGLSAQQEKEHRRHYASLTSEERTDPRAKLLKKLLDYIDGTLKADQYALLAEVEATTDNYHPSVRAPREPRIVEPVRAPAAVAADVQQFQAINEQANTMLDEVSIPFSCRVKK